MNIIGIGTDMVSIERIESIWNRFGESFARRILTPSETKALKLTQTPISFLAKRYAVKEAVSKALGTGFRPDGLLLTEIGVINDELGRPHLELLGRTSSEAQRRGVVESHISLSDEREFALAFVILCGENKS